MSIQDFIKGDFTAQDYDDDFAFLITSPEVCFWTLDGNQWKYVNYFYQTDAEGTGDSPDGWVDEQASYAEKIIKPGEGFWFIDMNPADADGCTIQLAGKVKGGPSDVEIKGTGYNMVCNPFPSALSINDPSFTMTGVTAIDYDDDFEFLLTSAMISFWRQDGKNWKYINYYYQTDAEGTGDSPDGWVDEQASYADGVNFLPSEGFWFLNPAGDATLHFGSPISK